jgi:RNA polymerase sigma-70 factor (ECF subfamily)
MQEIDSSTVNAWQRGDETATRALFDALYPYAVRMGALNGLSVDSARECAQDAFTHAYERRAQLRDTQAFALWFHRILTRRILDALKARHRRRETPLDTSDEALAEDWLRNAPLQPDEAAQDAESRREVWRRVQKLDPRARLGITLRYYSDYSPREVAEALGVSEGAARTLLSRALAQLRKLSTTDTAMNVSGAAVLERRETSHASINSY